MKKVELYEKEKKKQSVKKEEKQIEKKKLKSHKWIIIMKLMISVSGCEFKIMRKERWMNSVIVND